jgi:anti-sigma B factor antagonist
MTENCAVTRIAVEGELSIFKVADLRQRLLEAISDGTEVDVDLSHVSEIDSAGIQLLVAAKREAATRSKLLHFTGYSPAVSDIIELCNLAGHFGEPATNQQQPEKEPT